MSDIDELGDTSAEPAQTTSPFSDAQIRLTERLGKQLASQTATLGIAGSTIKLDPDQIDMVRGIHAQMLAGQKSMYAEAPTGFGKTVVILKILEALTRNGKPPRVMIAVPDMDAMETWRNAFEELAPLLTIDGQNPFEHIGFYHADQKDTDQPIILSTMTSMVMTNQSGVFKDDGFDIIIVDEGHGALSDLRKTTLGKSDAIRIYLSATPAYTHAKSLEQIAVRAYRCSPQHAEKRKLVAPFRNIIVAQPEITLDEGVLNKSGDFNLAELSRRAKATKGASVNQLLLDFYQNEKQPHNGQPFFGTHGIINCFNVEDSISTADEINKALEGKLPAGVIGAVALHGHTSAEDRRAAKKAYREGKILMLTGVKLLTHSFHDPRTCFVWNKLPSASGVQVGQRGGRARSVSRRPDALPKMAYIIDVLYNNVRLNAWQILYGEYMSGFLLDDDRKKKDRGATVQDAAEDDEDTAQTPATKKDKLYTGLDIKLLKAGTVVTDPDQVRELYFQRAQLLAELRPPPRWSTAFPALWQVAKKQRLYHARLISKALTEMGEEGHTTSKIQNILSGHVDFYSRDFLEWHPTCLAISRLLKRHVCDLFPISGLELPKQPNPDAVRRRRNREQFLEVLKEEGYTSFTDFARANDFSAQLINNIASEGVDNFSTQGWKADALKIADALGRPPEYVFGMPDEIRLIHDTIALVAHSQGTHAGIDLDPFLVVSRFDAETQLNIKQFLERFGDTIARAIESEALPPRAWEVLQKRFGIDPHEEMTLDELGAELSVSRERIRQIEGKSLRTLKHPSRAGDLRRILETLSS